MTPTSGARLFLLVSFVVFGGQFVQRASMLEMSNVFRNLTAFSNVFMSSISLIARGLSLSLSVQDEDGFAARHGRGGSY